MNDERKRAITQNRVTWAELEQQQVATVAVSWENETDAGVTGDQS